MICCCAGKTLVVISFQRYNIGAFGNATNTALDSSGNVVWNYDLGTVSQLPGPIQVPLIPGTPCIDGSGNVYIPSAAITDATVNPVLTSGFLDKVNISGTQVWRFTSVVGQTTSGVTVRPPGAAFDSSGNVLFTHARKATTFESIARVNSSGTLVTDYQLLAGTNSFPAGIIPSGGELISGIGLDSADNIYFVGTGQNSDQLLWKMNISGVYQSRLLLNATRCFSLDIDKANAKVFCGFTKQTTPVSTSTPYAQRVDCAAMTSDWVATVNLWNAFNLKFSSPTLFDGVAGQTAGAQICFNPNNLSVFLGGNSLSTSDTPNVILEQVMSLTNAGAKNWGTVLDPAVAGTIIRGTGCAFDPLNNNVYSINGPSVVRAAPQGRRVHCLDQNGNLVWSALPYGNASDGDSFRISCAQYQ